MATENMIKFLRGNVASLPQTATAGAVYFTKDEGLYLGLADGTYHRYGDFIEVANVDSLPASGAHVKAMYYCTAENILAKWNGTKWVQINKQQTLAELGGVAKDIYEAKMAALEKADTDNATAISGVDTRLQAAEKKLESVATTAGLEELSNTVKSHTAALDTINGDVNTAGSMLKIAKDAADAKDAAIKEAKDAADKAQGDVDTLTQTHATDKAALEGAIALKANAADVYDKDAIDGKVDTINEAIAAKAATADVYTKDDVDGMVDDLEAADLAINELIGDVTDGKTVVEMIADAQAAATYDDEEVRGLISDNADAIDQEIADREGAISDLKDELEGKIATKVEQDAYDTKVAALVAEDERLAGLINGNAADIEELSGEFDALVGEDTGKTVRAIANEELAAQLIPANAAEALNTLQEIATWIQEHPEDASAMNDAIVALQNKVDTGDVTVSAYVEAAIEALSIGDYATVAALGEAVERIVALEAASATHATQTALQGVVDELNVYKEAHKNDYDNDAVDAKVKGVQDQIDALNDTYATDAELEAAIAAEVERANGAYAAKSLESTVNTHVADAVKHITADERTAWNGAVSDLADHKAAYDAKVAELVAEDADIRIDFAAADTALKTELEAYADQAEADAVAAAKTETESQVSAVKTEMQGKIDTVSGALDTYKTENNTAVALKANAADVYNKAEVEAMLTWGEF